MFKRLLGGAVVALALVAAAAPALAQSAPEVEVRTARPADYEARAELVRRYFTAIQLDKLMNGVMEQMMAAMADDPRIPEEKQALIRQVASEAFAVVAPQMMEASVEVYAVEFTHDELQQLVTFYESPVGRSLMTKSVMLTQRSNEIFGRFQPILQQEMERRFCARMDCPAEGAAPAAPAARKPR